MKYRLVFGMITTFIEETIAWSYGHEKPRIRRWGGKGFLNSALTAKTGEARNWGIGNGWTNTKVGREDVKPKGVAYPERTLVY